MWELDCKENWTLKNWCFWTMVLEKTLESALDCKEIQPVHPKGDQHWTLIGRTEAEVEVPILWPPDTKSWPIGKDPDAGKNWRQEEKRTTEDTMVGWHHWLDGHEFEETPGVGDGQESLGCYSPWDRKELDTTEWLNWTVNFSGLEFLGDFKKKKSVFSTLELKGCCLNVLLAIQNREVTYAVRMHKTEIFSRYIEISLFLPKVHKQWPSVFLSVSLTWHQFIALHLMVTDLGVFC